MAEIVEIRDEYGELLKSHKVASGASGLRGAVMEGAELTGAQLAGADMEGIDLYWGILFLANLEGADLKGANLTGANLRSTLFEGATYNEKTRFPAGFNPKKAGMAKSNDS